MRFSASRRTDQLADPIQTESALAAVAATFGESWLDEPGIEPIRDLWLRRDTLAVNQLFILGQALIGTRRIDPKWTARQVTAMKKNANNRRGAIFEVVAISMMNIGGRVARPTGRDAPGFDAIVTFPAGDQLALSLKSYGTSLRDADFRRDAGHIEMAFAGMLGLSHHNGLVLGAFADGYPTPENWNMLEGALPDMIAHYGAASAKGLWHLPPWTVMLREVPEAMRPLSERHSSHQVLIGASFHQNEQQNLISKLEEAAANGRRQADKVGAMQRGVFIHLPETFPMHACIEWSNQYLQNHPDGPLGTVLFHQLQVTSSGERSGLTHTLVPCETPAYVRWRSEGRQLGFNPHVGTVSDKPIPLILEGVPDVPLERMYLYQRGEYWRAFSEGDMATLSNPAPGVFQHAVSKLDGSELSLQGLFPPSGWVTLFD